MDEEKEKEYLDKIAELYEKHRAETDPEKKKEIIFSALLQPIRESFIRSYFYCVAGLDTKTIYPATINTKPIKSYRPKDVNLTRPTINSRIRLIIGNANIV